MLIDCDICYSPYDSNLVLRCYKCHLGTCGTCLDQYHQMPTTTSLSCMNPSCGTEWDMTTLRLMHLNPDLINTIYDIRVEYLFKREVEYMKDTYLKHNVTMIKDEVIEHNDKLHKYVQSIMDPQVGVNPKYLSNIREYLNNIARVQQKLIDMDHVSAHTHIDTCPILDCNGYITILSNQCQTCQAYRCTRCDQGVSKDSDHECDPKDIATFAEVNRTTKKCPNVSCKARIHLIEGCDDMWCTKCNTAFNWKSGEIVDTKSRNYHNIHHQQYLQARRDIELTNDNFGCFIGENGNLSILDLPTRRSDPAMYDFMRNTIIIDRLLMDKWQEKPHGYGIDTLEDVRMELIKNNSDINSVESMKIVKDAIRSRDQVIELERDLYDLYFYLVRISKDIIIERLNEYRRMDYHIPPVTKFVNQVISIYTLYSDLLLQRELIHANYYDHIIGLIHANIMDYV